MHFRFQFPAPLTDENERRQALLPLLDNRASINVRTLLAELSIPIQPSHIVVTLAPSIGSRYHAAVELEKQYLAVFLRMLHD